MIIKRYGIELHRLRHEDIELVRTMRNRDDIRSTMFAQEYISAEQQEAWFRSVNNFRNFFFIIHYDGRKIGLIQGKDIDFDQSECEGGIYIWDSSLLGTAAPAMASICLIEFQFEIAGIERVYARIRPDNIRAWKYNLAMGFQPCSRNGEQCLALEKNQYQKVFPRLRRMAAGSGKDPGPLTVENVVIPAVDQDWHLYAPLPDGFRSKLAPLLEGANHNHGGQDG